MKLHIHFLTLLFLLSGMLIAQAPQGISYQAVIRDASGNPMLNRPVQMRFTVAGNGGADVHYQEIHSTSSDALGGIHLVIGNGNATVGSFPLIEWNSGNIQIAVEMDPNGGQNFSPFGTNSMQSVPYALYAHKAGSLDDNASIDPGQIGSGGADVGQVLIWNGNEWSPGDDQDEQILTVNGNQLAISNGNAVTLPTGSGGDNWGSQTIVTEPELTGNGTLVSPLSIATQGASNGDVLKWNGNSWVPQDDNGQNYTAGNGIAINGGTISNTGDNDNNATNEIQTLSINGNVVSLTNGGSINLPTYTEGPGIDINGNTISATNAQAMWNANQLQSRNVSAAAPTNGQVLKWDGANWGPGADNGGSYTEGTGINIVGNVISAENTNNLWNANQLQGRSISTAAPSGGQVLKFNPDLSQWFPGEDDDDNPWSIFGNNIAYTAGNVGFGVTNPLERIHVFDEDKIRMDDQTFGKWASISFEFSGNVVPAVDDNRDLGTTARRWDDVYATSGIVNTSDIRDKTNIQSLSYGLDDILKLRPVSFTWKDKPEKGTKLGLIAQELETVIPEVVSNPERTPSANSEPEAGGEIRLGVYYSDLIPVLIKAIQEQEEKIILLQKEIEILKQH